MDLRNQLRKPEQKPLPAPQRQANRAGGESADTERRLRRKMRIYPDESRAVHQSRDPESPAARKAIISIRGRDVQDENDGEDYECGHLIQSR